MEEEGDAVVGVLSGAVAVAAVARHSATVQNIEEINLPRRMSTAVRVTQLNERREILFYHSCPIFFCMFEGGKGLIAANLVQQKDAAVEPAPPSVSLR